MDCKPAIQLWLPFVRKGEQSCVGSAPDNPSEDEQLMEQVLDRDNLFRALRQVKSNGGSPGVDGMTVGELSAYLREHWPRLKEELLAGAYQPQPVRRVEIPKPGGEVRKLGVPTALDRVIQQALLQVLQDRWDETFSESSFGFRPGAAALIRRSDVRRHI